MMTSVGSMISQMDVFRLISQSQKHCDKHGIDYTEKVYARYTQGCPECAKEAEKAREEENRRKLEAERNEVVRKQIEKRVGESKIPLRFVGKTLKGYAVDAGNQNQQAILGFIKAYAREFEGKHSGRSIALLGNAGTGKTHLACAVGNYLLNHLDKTARFISVSELNRLVRESKSYNSEVSETEVISSFAGYDLLIIDEVGVQSGTEAESRALFDVFNERYQSMKPTILISNLGPRAFAEAVGARIADRIKEDGGAMLLFDWGSNRK